MTQTVQFFTRAYGTCTLSGKGGVRSEAAAAGGQVVTCGIEAMICHVFAKGFPESIYLKDV